MSEKEKEIIKKLSNTVPKLDKDKQNYILGVAEAWQLPGRISRIQMMISN